MGYPGNNNMLKTQRGHREKQIEQQLGNVVLVRCLLSGMRQRNTGGISVYERIKKR